MAAVALLAAAVSAVAGPAAPRVIAHRGGAALWPENSLTAFRGALALGVAALEFDVHLTADGTAVVIHDPTLDRTTTGRGPVRAVTLPTLAHLRLLDRARSATVEAVPTLDEVLALVPSPLEVLPEIKLDADGGRYPAVEEQVLRLLRDRQMLARATVQSFDEPTLARVRELAPSVRTMLLVSRRHAPGDALEPRSILEAVRRVGATDLGVHHRLVDAALVAVTSAAGLRLSVWTVNEIPEMRRLADLGVDAVMTDRPDLALSLLGRPPAPVLR